MQGVPKKIGVRNKSWIHYKSLSDSYFAPLNVLYNMRSYCRAPRPIPSCLVPYLSYTRPLQVLYTSPTLHILYLSLTHLASLGLIKGRGQTLYLILLPTHSRVPIFVTYPFLTLALPVCYLFCILSLEKKWWVKDLIKPFKLVINKLTTIQTSNCSWLQKIQI